MLSFILIIAFSVGSYQKGKDDQLKQDKIVIDYVIKVCNQKCELEKREEER